MKSNFLRGNRLRYFSFPIFKIAIVLWCLFLVIFIIVFINISQNSKANILENYEKNVELTVFEKMKSIIKCYDNNYDQERYQQGDYWILKNFVRADHGKLSCYESITMTTSGDFTFLQYLPTLVKRWRAPISMTLFAPGTDFFIVLKSLKYLLKCQPFSFFIRKYVTFHVFFPLKHIPKYIPFNYEEWWVLTEVDCNDIPPYEYTDPKFSYRSQHNLLYPVNFARNLARDASQTYFVFPNEVQLFPSPNLVEEFFKMIVRNSSILTGEDPRVFVVPSFEVSENESIPNNKSELLNLLNKGHAKQFDSVKCPFCHIFPNKTEWFNYTDSYEMNIFLQTKRLRELKSWEPFYIGTKKDPFFDERVSWEGQSNRRIQHYALCLLNYDYLILDNGFLVHKQLGEMSRIEDQNHNFMDQIYVSLTNKLIKNVIVPELRLFYGERGGCEV